MGAGQNPLRSTFALFRRSSRTVMHPPRLTRKIHKGTHQTGAGGGFLKTNATRYSEPYATHHELGFRLEPPKEAQTEKRSTPIASCLHIKPSHPSGWNMRLRKVYFRPVRDKTSNFIKTLNSNLSLQNHAPRTLRAALELLPPHPCRAARCWQAAAATAGAAGFAQLLLPSY